MCRAGRCAHAAAGRGAGAAAGTDREPWKATLEAMMRKAGCEPRKAEEGTHFCGPAG